MMSRALWMLRMVIAAVVASGFTANALAQSPRSSTPVMTDELMARLIKYTRAISEPGRITGKLCAIFELCEEGTKELRLKQAKSDATDADHIFALPLNADSKDILILVDRPEVMYLYLTDKTGRLRAAAISDKTGVRLIANEKAVVKFKAELALFAKEAAQQLPAK